MFTGIIEEIGVVSAIENKPNLSTVSLKAPKVGKGIKLGDSVAINGVCLTVSKIKGSMLSFDLMRETLKATTLGTLKSGARVNLERAMQSGSRFGGHFVTGHVDGMGRITKILKDKNYTEFQIQCPVPLRKFIVPKGSICINGISLTVGAIIDRPYSFSVYMIPFTMKATTMAEKKTGDQVNIEADILARYVLS